MIGDGSDARRRRTSDVTRKTKLINLRGSYGQIKILRPPNILIFHALFDFIKIKKYDFYSFHGPLIMHNFCFIHLEIEPDSEQYSSYLSDKDMTWPEIEDSWRKTIYYRLHFLKNNNPAEIFNKWQQYTKPMGYKLVSLQQTLKV